MFYLEDYMKTVAVIVLLSCCAFGQDKAAESAADAACGPSDVDFEVHIDASAHPRPVPEMGKAVIYVVQKASSFATRFGIDGKWVDALKRNTYLSAPIEPGEHHLCAMGPSGDFNFVSLHGLNAKANMTYYFTVHVLHGEVYYDYSLSPTDADEGKYLVAGAKLSISHPK